MALHELVAPLESVLEKIYLPCEKLATSLHTFNYIVVYHRALHCVNLTDIINYKCVVIYFKDLGTIENIYIFDSRQRHHYPDVNGFISLLVVPSGG